MKAVDLGVLTVKELLSRAGIDPASGVVDEVVFGRDIDKSNEAVLHAYVPLKWPPRVVNPEAPLTEAERQELSALEASLRQERELTTKVADQLYAKQAVRWEREEYRMLRDV